MNFWEKKLQPWFQIMAERPLHTFLKLSRFRADTDAGGAQPERVHCGAKCNHK